MIGIWLLIILGIVFILIICGVSAGLAFIISLISTVAFKTSFWICLLIVIGINIFLVITEIIEFIKEDDLDK
jgi:hypothetical protein